ncbi:hypothetical protein OS493_020255 [Desmophyllum pertusum]|uniref:Uncharacterized protein n=1 Tax=Desmophyllum pertusum TaxID=174260 RepID=A0A9X0D4L6_9CNID|nr:hypothetical protein OS493_020255 [Desmophyllum pertusum]
MIQRLVLRVWVCSVSHVPFFPRQGDGGTGDVTDNCGDVNDSCTSDGNDNSKECDGKDTEVAELDTKDNQTSFLQTSSSSSRRRILEA